MIAVSTPFPSVTPRVHDTICHQGDVREVPHHEHVVSSLPISWRQRGQSVALFFINPHLLLWMTTVSVILQKPETAKAAKRQPLLFLINNPLKSQPDYLSFLHQKWSSMTAGYNRRPWYWCRSCLHEAIRPWHLQDDARALLWLRCS